MSRTPRIGVLALQGDVREHDAALRACGAEPVAVRRPEQLSRIDGLVLPGGESTTIGRLLGLFELLEPLRAAVRSGLPVYGSCAGMILLAREVLDGRPEQPTVGGLDIVVRRNAFGRQVESFETDLTLDGLDAPVHAVFIRAPWVERAGADVQVLARVPGPGVPGHGGAGSTRAGSTRTGSPRAGSPRAGSLRAGLPAAGRVVAVRQGRVLATSFHPELTGDPRVHGLFVAMVEEAVG